VDKLADTARTPWIFQTDERSVFSFVSLVAAAVVKGGLGLEDVQTRMRNFARVEG
jgi:hypothetical protein